MSEVSLGSWLTLGSQVDYDETARLVHRAFDLGVFVFDTADVYQDGEAERALGQAIQSIPRQHVVLATKCFFPMLEPLFGATAFDVGGHRFTTFVASLGESAQTFLDVWTSLRYDMVGSDVRGPLDQPDIAIDYAAGVQLMCQYFAAHAGAS